VLEYEEKDKKKLAFGVLVRGKNKVEDKVHMF